MDKVVAVVIPTVNRKRLTDQAVESVRSVHPGSVEIVVVDDHGDEPYRYNAEANSSGIEVRVVRRDSNGGAGLARMTGVNASSGKVIAFLDSDDQFGQSWIDDVIHASLTQDSSIRDASIYVGRVASEKATYEHIWRLFLVVSPGRRLLFGRFVTTFFNPFPTPSLAMSRELCRFSDRLRYCEDYFTVAEAVFRARRLVVINSLACILGRRPKSPGGISDKKMNMFKGEMAVRKGMLKGDYIPLVNKMLVPLGMLYQLLRTAVKLDFIR